MHPAVSGSVDGRASNPDEPASRVTHKILVTHSNELDTAPPNGLRASYGKKNTWHLNRKTSIRSRAHCCSNQVLGTSTATRRDDSQASSRDLQRVRCTEQANTRV